MWKPFPPPLVPGLDKASPYTAKRFYTTNLLDLVRDKMGLISLYRERLGISAPELAIKFVIKDIDYPFNLLGMPDDSHYLVAYGGNVVYSVLLDYWAADYETLLSYLVNRKIGRHGYGDCEDTSILLGSLLRALGIKYWVVFGVVYKGSMLLGGHAWVIADLPFQGWSLLETTLDQMPPYPEGFPKINPDRNVYTVGDLVYVGMLRFNHEEYQEWVKEGEPETEIHRRFKDYLSIPREQKENVIKYRAIAFAWGIDAKPLTRLPPQVAEEGGIW